MVLMLAYQSYSKMHEAIAVCLGNSLVWGKEIEDLNRVKG